MNISKISKIYDILLGDEFSMIYSGNFNNSILISLTDLINSFMSSPNIDLKKLNKKVAYMTIENFQNILRYSETRIVQERAKDMLLVRVLEKNIFIITVNMVSKINAEKITKYIDELNRLNKEELSELYFKKLTEQGFSAQGGAGLGFIEMLRKTKNKLFYNFLPYDSDFLYFYFQIQISEKNVINKDINLLDSVPDIYSTIKYLGANFLYKSKLSEGLLSPLIRIIKDTASSSINSNFLYIKNLLNISVEILQDTFATSRQSKLMKDAIFVYGFNFLTENFYFLASTFVDADIISKKINYINYYLNKDNKEIEQEYNKALLSDEVSDEQLRLLGVFSRNIDLEYFVDLKKENKVFFVQKVEVLK